MTKTSARVTGPQDLRATPHVVGLQEHDATRVEVTGGKAAALARAARSGLPTLSGFAITTAGMRAIDAAGGDLDAADASLRRAFDELTDHGQRSVIVRSSAPAEDAEESSMAGQFESVADVRSWDDLADAVRTVLDSRARAAEHDETLRLDEPIAALVQPMLAPQAAGVLFGVDPVSGRDDRVVVSAVAGQPEQLVSGEVEGTDYELTATGDVVDVRRSPDGVQLTTLQLRQLAALAGRVRRAFGGPQDVEWAFDEDGDLVLLQSRPVTTAIAAAPSGPVFGPGPVAETFPEPLAPLEQDLWLPPLRHALTVALSLSGMVSDRQLDASPVLIGCRGRVAVDLELFGEYQPDPPFWRRLDPRPIARRLRSAWRVGRLKAALPGLARDLIVRTDDELGAVPAMDDLTDRQLLAMLRRSREALAALHGHEVLMGLLIGPENPRLTGNSVALRMLAHARGSGLEDHEILRRYPIVLALCPPLVVAAPELPRSVDAPPWQPADDRSDDNAILREALRLRVRLVQELMSRGAWTLAERLVERDVIAGPELVRGMRLQSLEAAVLGHAVVRPDEDAADFVPGPPLPARFRRAPDGTPVPVLAEGSDSPGGTGAGGGRGEGVVHHGDDEDPPHGSVLVVRTLHPDLARHLPKLAGLVCETGSVLSHVAILAREQGVPTVVGVGRAQERLPEGRRAVVDGDGGSVELTGHEDTA